MVNVNAKRFINNIFQAPFYIFIRFDYAISDDTVIKKLGIEGYSPCEALVPKRKSYTIWDFYITEKSGWTHIIDDCYQLWFDGQIRDHIQEIAEDGYEIFYCSVGDIDPSFDFVYYQDGVLKRKYVFDIIPGSPTSELAILENTGIPLVGEESALQLKDPWEKIMSLAKSLNIPLINSSENMRCYSLEVESFQFNEDEY